MGDSHITTIEQIKTFLQLNQGFTFAVAGKREKYQWIEEALRKFGYHRLKKKKERSIVCKYIRKAAGISKAQLKRLIRKHRKCGKLVPNVSQNRKHGFHTIYGPEDIALLIATDAAHHHLSGEATKRILIREHEVFHREAYRTVCRISVAHLYHIRGKNRQYNSSSAKWVHHTRPSTADIGIRAKPRPGGKPGFLRVDTVHSGDERGEKGVYHLNIVDEVTQWEMIATVPAISELFLKPVIETLLLLFPFKIEEFHSDNGSEFVNYVVAELLTKLYVRFTKSRARHSNDNALVESKNGSIIRKLYGRNHIPKEYAPFIDTFNHTWVNIYLNYHRPCGFAEDRMDARGKIKKKYTQWMTPYDRLKSLPSAQQYLEPGATFETLDTIAYAKSDNEFAEEMEKAKAVLFKKLRKL